MFPTTCFTPLDCRNQRASDLFLFKSIDNLFAAWRENAPEQTEVGDKIWSKKGKIWK